MNARENYMIFVYNGPLTFGVRLWNPFAKTWKVVTTPPVIPQP